MSTRTVHDPFLGEDVQVSNKLTDRLRGKYAIGPVQPNGEPEFGWRQFETPPIQHEAADYIEALEAALRLARKRLEYYGAISARRHFDHDLAEVYPQIDAATLSAPDIFPSHFSNERLPSSDAAGSGADTDRPEQDRG